MTDTPREHRHLFDISLPAAIGVFVDPVAKAEGDPRREPQPPR